MVSVFLLRMGRKDMARMRLARRMREKRSRMNGSENRKVERAPTRSVRKMRREAFLAAYTSFSLMEMMAKMRNEKVRKRKNALLMALGSENMVFFQLF